MGYSEDWLSKNKVHVFFSHVIFVSLGKVPGLFFAEMLSVTDIIFSWNRLSEDPFLASKVTCEKFIVEAQLCQMLLSMRQSSNSTGLTLAVPQIFKLKNTLFTVHVHLKIRPNNYNCEYVDCYVTVRDKVQI